MLWPSQQPVRRPGAYLSVAFYSRFQKQYSHTHNPDAGCTRADTRDKEVTMTDPAWPRDERPRERLLAHGSESLSDAELLAIFLRTGTTGMPVMELSRFLLQEFSGLRGLLTASRRQFCGVKGLGTAKYAQVQAAMEMARRVMDEPLRQGDPL